jgi:hypothetical protein
LCRFFSLLQPRHRAILADSFSNDDALDWLATDHRVDTRSLTPLARKAMARIIVGSELQELWDESDSKAKWRAEMTDLMQRLA